MSHGLMLLIVNRIAELEREAVAAHTDLESWRDPAYTSMERTRVGLKLTQALDESKKWINSLREGIESCSDAS